MNDKRITIIIDLSIDKKLRLLQAKKIIQTQGSVSYSSVINDILKKAL